MTKEEINPTVIFYPTEEDVKNFIKNFNPNRKGYLVSRWVAEGYISPFIGKAEFLDDIEPPKTKIFHVDEKDMIIIE